MKTCHFQKEISLDQTARRTDPPSRTTHAERSRQALGLRPFGDDSTFADSVSRGEFVFNGCRNRNLRPSSFPAPPSRKKPAAAPPGQAKRRLLSHGLSTKITAMQAIPIPRRSPLASTHLSGRTVIVAHFSNTSYHTYAEEPRLTDIGPTPDRPVNKRLTTRVDVTRTMVAPAPARRGSS